MNFVATTILEQLGGNKFIVMTGAKQFYYNANSVTFKVMKSKGINLVKVILEADDTYTMQFYKVHAAKSTLMVEEKGVYCDMLQQVFTAKTGLYTHL